LLLSIDIGRSKLACIGHILKGKVRLILYPDRIVARVIDRAMRDISEKLEKATRGSGVALNAPCANMKSINIQTNA